MQRLGQTGDIGIVSQNGGDANKITDPVGEREAVPAGDLMRFDDRMSVVIDGAAETDADAAQMTLAQAALNEQFGKRVHDLATDALGTGGGIDDAAPQPEQLAVALADAELQLRAAD